MPKNEPETFTYGEVRAAVLRAGLMSSAGQLVERELIKIAKERAPQMPAIVSNPTPPEFN